MPNDLIRYDLLIQQALCGVVRKVLSDAAREGLPGDHHFSITFRTRAPGVRLSTRMREQYPEEMTIILQHQFDALSVTEHAFEVGLSFRGIPERLLIPFDALTGFFDPSVKFGLKFEAQAEEVAELEAAPEPTLPREGVTSLGLLAGPGAGKAAKVPTKTPAEPLGKSADAPAEGEEAKVVSIDAFRKKT